MSFLTSRSSNSSLHDAEDTSQTSTPHTLPDLEEAKTQPDLDHAASTQRVSRIQSLTRRRTRFEHPLSHVQTSADVVVDFDGPDDPYRPMNWPFRKKIITTVLYGFTTMGSTWASSVYSPAVIHVSKEFHVGTEVSLLGISILLVGFGLGPLVWAPLSEVYGRKHAVLVPYFLAAVFSFATAVAKDIQTIIITRFFTGFFGSAPVTNTGGVLGDIWAPTQRGTAIVGYAFAVVGGPIIGMLSTFRDHHYWILQG